MKEKITPYLWFDNQAKECQIRKLDIEKIVQASFTQGKNACYLIKE